MAATKTITNTFGHIIIFDSAGNNQSLVIPKSNLTVIRRQNEGSGEEIVLLRWSSGGRGVAKDSAEITYDEIISPTVASNAALEALLKAWCGTPMYLITADGLVHEVDHYAIIGNTTAILALVYEDGVARGDLAGKQLSMGVPIFSGLNGAGIFTHIKLTSGTVLICPTGAGNPPYTTSTTSTTTT